MTASGIFILLIYAVICCAAPNLENDHCTKPVQINGAQLQGEWHDETYPPGKVAHFACLPEYTQDGPIKMACIEGNWFHIAKGQCKEEIRCSPHDPVIKGRLVATKTRYKLGDEIDIECEDGYVLNIEPNKRRQCTANGWSPSTRCVTKKCDKPYIKSGNLDTDYGYPKEVKSSIWYYCDRGYQPRSWKKIHCTEAGWSPEPKCLRECARNDAYFPNGDPLQLKPEYLEGDKVEFRCNANYHTPDGKRYGERLCLPNGQFSPAKCSVTSCGPPPEVPNSRIIGGFKSSYASDEKVTYECISGYSLERTGVAQCENANWITIPVCRRTGEQCGPPPTVIYGDTLQVRRANYRSGESVEFRCPEYYVLQGNKFVNCKNGIWSEAPLCIEPCTAKERDMEENNIQFKWISEKKLYSMHGNSIDFICKSGYEALPGTQMRAICQHGKLGYPKCFKSGFCLLQQSIMISNNIHYNLSTVVDHGQTILFQCNEGTMPENKLDAKCEWGKINYPRCTTAKNCEPPKVLNGHLITEQQVSYDSGSYVEFDCNEGYAISVAIKVKCENGQWSKLPECYSPCKISPEDLTKHNIQLLPSNDAKNIPDKYYKHGTEISVICKSGFRRPILGHLVIECNDGKFKYQRCFSGRTCRINQDNVDENNLELDEMHNNEIFYAEGEIIQYKCTNGFYYSGKPTGTCSEGTMIYPKCTEPSCQPPPDVPNSRIIGGTKSSYVFGDKVTYECIAGYSLDKTGVAQCEDKNWINIPACRRIGEQCGPPPTVQYGDTAQVRKANYRSGERVEFRCPDYYVLQGNKFVTCMNGIWNEAPVCMEPCTAKEREMEENNIQFKWISDKKLYSEHGGTIAFICKPGYEAPPGTEMRPICQQGRLEYPKCFKI